MDEALIDYVKDGESFRQDFKRKTVLEDSDSLAKHLTAFANRRGGRLIFGITDDKQLERARIDREEATLKVSNVARNRCDPPVGFSSEFYRQQESGDKEGDVLLIQVEPYEFAPHAVLDRGSRAKRTYYLRTAEESREVADSSELRSLFLTKPDEVKEYQCGTWTVYENESYEYLDVHPYPSGPEMFRDFYRQLSEEDIEFIKREDWKEDEEVDAMAMWPASEDSKFGKAIQEIAPLVLLRHLDGSPADFWFNHDEIDRIDRQRYESKSTTLELSKDNIEFENSPSVLKELSVSPSELIQYPEPLKVPRGTKLVVGYPTGEREYSRILLKKADYFEIEIGFSRPRHRTVIGLPIRYPGYVEPGSNPVSEGLTISLEAEFGFPDIEDRDIDLHQKFADGWISYLQDHWDWNQFVDRTPDRAVYRIQQQLDDIEDLLSDSNQKEIE